MPDMPNGLFPVLTLLLGYATKSVSEWIQHRRISHRDREAREAARRDHLSERRDSFQRQTLLDLQEAIMQLIRMAGAMHHRDIMAYRQTGKWQKQLFDDELSEGSRLAVAQTSMLSVRVRDDSIRAMVDQVKHHAGNAGMCATEQESVVALSSMGSAFVTLNQRIGEVLRKLDDDPLPPQV
jgi:hypothetical protein